MNELSNLFAILLFSITIILLICIERVHFIVYMQKKQREKGDSKCIIIKKKNERKKLLYGQTTNRSIVKTIGKPTPR